MRSKYSNKELETILNHVKNSKAAIIKNKKPHIAIEMDILHFAHACGAVAGQAAIEVAKAVLRGEDFDNNTTPLN